MKNKNSWLPTCLLALLALTPGLMLAPSAGAQGFGHAPKDAPNLVLLEVRLDAHLLSDSVTAYQFGDDVFLPLGELSKLLTIAIRTQPAEGRASGYILDEQRAFALDVLAREVTVADQREALDRSRVKLQADDIYVASRLLARWLPVDLEVDMPTLTLKVRPRETLPLQAGLERNKRNQRVGAGGVYVDPKYPLQRTPYRLWDTPFIDQTLGVDVRRAGGASQTGAAYTAYLTADLLGMEASLFLSSNVRNLTPDPRFGPDRIDPDADPLEPLPTGAPARSSDLRFTLGRNDPDAGLLGPLRARTVLVGSVPVPGVANIARASPTGNGATIGNRPLNQPALFDRHNLQGDLPPGWDVELYFNDALVAFQQSRPDGKYSFDNLALVYGPNEFRLVFHGPLGQLRVERQNFLLEQSSIAPGQLYYNLTGHRDGLGRKRAVAQFDWGLSSRLSANWGLARLQLGETEQNYANLGLHGYLQSFIVSGELARSGTGGTLAQVGLKTRVRGLTLAASHAEARDFASELYLPTADPVRSRDLLRVDGSVPGGASSRLPVVLEVKRDRLASDKQNIEVIGRISAYKYGTALSNAVRWQSFGGARSADGLLQASRRVAGVGVSGQLQYTIEPTSEISALALSADKYLSEGYLLNLGLTHVFEDSQYRLSASLNKSVGSFGLGVNGYYSNRGDYGVGLQLFVAMGLEPRRSRWITDAQPMAANGAASVRVFLDKNQNGVMDAGEEPLSGAGFTVNGGGNLARTDADGIAYLNRLPVAQNIDIGFDVSTLDDPQLAAQKKGTRIVPRPGKVAQLDFPVSVTGEIDGTTYMVVNGVKRAIGDLELELVDANRKVVATSKSASDGYFVVSSVVPGNYLLRISKAQLQRLDLNDMGMHLLTIAPDGAFINGKELYVEANAK